MSKMLLLVMKSRIIKEIDNKFVALKWLKHKKPAQLHLKITKLERNKQD